MRVNTPLEISAVVATFWRRFLLATTLWVLFWPILWFIRIGEITGPKSWFWIVGELNYPVAAIAYWIVDEMLERHGWKGWVVFVPSAVLVALAMSFFYPRVGFSMGVLTEAFLF